MTDRNDLLYRLIGFKINKFRNEKHLSQDFLATKCNLERTSIVHIEKGKQRTPLDRLYLIAEVLGVNVKDLLPDKSQISGFEPV